MRSRDRGYIFHRRYQKAVRLKQELVHTDVAKPIRIARAITTTEIKDIILFDIGSVLFGLFLQRKESTR
ncbi:MAG: hypothetical protein A3204_05620 [Candidatus Methanarcanum hacksteinii]|nr:MAG: hypothetical protein A3204_05620 [Candidatus Methanarcanum hacksteinii]